MITPPQGSFSTPLQLETRGLQGADCTPSLHNKIPALKIFARGWVAQESLVLHYQR